MPSDKAPQIPPTPEQEPILSFEEFSDRGEFGDMPRYNNFYLCFDIDNRRNKKEYYSKFKLEHPSMASSLCENMKDILKSRNRPEALKAVDREMYEAYKIMRGYGFSNHDLFT